MAAPPDIPSLHSAVTSALLSTTRTVNELCAEDLDFHRSLDPQLGRNLDRQNARLLGLVERLINNATADLTSNTAGSGKGKGKGGDLKLTQDLGGEGTVAEAIEGNWGRVVDIVDALLEKADASLDEFTGVVKRGKLQSILEPDKVETDGSVAFNTQRLHSGRKS